MNSAQPAEFLQMASSLQKKGLSFDEIFLHLKEKGATESLLQDIIQQLKQLRISRKRKIGFVYCGIGVVLLVVSCMLTLLLFNNGGSMRVVMYGLTTIGIVFTLKGLADLLGW
ncbi:MAG: hypothetical protein V9F01_02665 [Chitinophagaceae bacterium]